MLKVIAFGCAIFTLLTSAVGAQCVGRNAYNGLPQPAIITQGMTPGNAFAFTSFYPNGQPGILLGPRYFQLAPILRRFTDIHECAHANGAIDEVQANCIALQTMRSQGLSAANENVIAQWHIGYGPIGQQYGGTGANFWQYTLQCAGPR